MKKFYYLMCPPLSPYCRYIKIKRTKNRQFALAYSLGKIRLSFIWSMDQEQSIYGSEKLRVGAISIPRNTPVIKFIQKMKTTLTIDNQIKRPKSILLLSMFLLCFDGSSTSRKRHKSLAGI